MIGFLLGFVAGENKHYSNFTRGLANQERVRYSLNMHSKNSIHNQSKPRKTFVEQARRNQIIQATIEVLAEFGYINTSFARIGKHIKISPSLISYHFKDKDELTRVTLQSILGDRAKFVQEKVESEQTAADKLYTLIESDIINMSNHPEQFRAAAEIMFSFRADKGSLLYLGDNESPLFMMLHDTLKEGKKNGEFGNIDIYNLAIIIEGALDSFLAQLGVRPKFEVDQFTKTLLKTVMLVVKKGNNE
jgi:TetR/AcrR family transcriptional repressor of bet genes